MQNSILYPIRFSMKQVMKSRLKSKSVQALCLLVALFLCPTFLLQAETSDPQALNLSVQIIATDVLCTDDENGTLSADASGGTLPYTYLWSNGATDQSLSNMAPGIYFVTVTDANGTTADDSAKIENPEPLSVETGSNYETCEGSADAHVSANAAGGTGAHTFTWSNGMTGYIVEGLSAGDYQVTVTDENGCSVVGSQTIELSPEGVWIMTSSTDVTCAGGADGTAHVGAMTGEAPYTYLWSDPAMQTSDDAINLSAGTYFVTVTDNNGCTAVDEVTINDGTGTPISITTSSSYATCDASSDASATAEAEGGEGALTYTWSNGMSGFKIENIPAGTYTVTVTDENGCSATATEIVELSPEGIWLMVSSTNVTCHGASDGTAHVSAMTGEPPYTYLWSDPAMQTSDDAVGLNPGIYTVTVTDSNGCSASESVTITAPEEIIVFVTPTVASCDNDGTATAAAANGVEPYTFLWDDPANQTGATATGLAPGTYHVTVTDATGCSESDTALVLSDCNPVCEADAGTISIDAPTVCLENEMASLYGTPNGDQVVPNGYATLYVLTTGTDLTILQTSADPKFIVEAEGIYTIHTLVYDPATLDLSTVMTAADVLNLIDDPSVCADLDVAGVMVTVEDCQVMCQTPVVESVVIIEPSCGNTDGMATINVFGSESDFTFTWTPNVSSTHIAENIGSGVYIVVIKDPSDPSCPEVKEIFTVGNLNGPEVEITATTPATCQESNGTASLSPFGLTYNWCSGEVGNNAVNLPAGECQVTVTDPATGCVDVIEVVIGAVNPLMADPVVVQQPDCGMANGAVDIIVSNGSFNYNYLWEDGNMSSSRTGLAAGTYSVTVSDAGPTACNRIVEFVLTENVPAAIVSIDSPAFTSCPGTNDAMVEFTVDFENGFAQPAMVTILDDAGNEMTNGSLPVGNYCIVVKDANGCFAGGDCFVVESPSQIDVDVAIVDKDCSMGGSITLVDVHGGNGGFIFDWSDLPGDDNPRNRTNLSVGTYSVVVRDSVGCQLEITGITIEDTCCDDPPVIANVIVFEAHCGASDGRAEIIMVGNANDYTYTWSPSVSLTNAAFDIPAGTYTVTITDVSDATCFIVHAFTVGTIDGPMATATTTPATCQLADGTAQLLPDTYTYEWSDNATGANREGLTAGFYSVTVTDPDVSGCIDILTVVVEEVNPLTVEAIINQEPDCGLSNGSVTLNVTGGSGEYIYTWGNTNTRDDLPSGAYSVVVNDVLWGCEKTIEFILLDSVPSAAITITTTDVTCIGESDGTVEFSLELENGFAEPATVTVVQNGQTVVGPFTAGDYCLVVTDANGCVAGGDCFTINEPTQLDVDVAVVAADCDQGGSIDLAVSGSTPPYTYNWDDLAGMNNPEDRVNLSNGSYQVTIVDANDCAVVINNINVEDECDCEAPVISSVVVVESTCGNADGRATVNVAGGPDGFVFTWEGGISTTHQAFDLVAGTYAVTIADPLDATCSIEEIFTVGNSDGPNADLTITDANCNASDGGVMFSPVDFTYQWNDGVSSNNRNDLAAGIYQVTIVDPADSICYDVQTVEVGELNSLEINYSVIQKPDCFQSNGVVTLNVLNGSGNYAYSWGSDATMSNLSSGVYMITATDLDSGCEQDLIFALDDNVEQAIVNVSGVPEMSCPGANDGSIAFTLSGNFVAPTTTIIKDAAGNVYDNGSLSAGSYCLLVTDANGCAAGSHCFVIKDPEQLDVDIAIIPASCVGLGAIQLVEVTGGTGTYTYSWSDNGNILDPTNRTDLSGGNYGLTVTDSNGCSVSELLSVDDSAYTPMITLDPTNIICHGMNNGAIVATVANATEPLVIDWEHGATTLDLIDLMPGVYTVTITDANQCSSTASVAIEEPPMINLTLPVDTTICDESILVVANAGVGGLTYTWTDVNGLNLGTNSVLLVSPDSSQLIFVEVVDSLGCSEKDSIIVANGQPMISLQGPQIACLGASETQLNVLNGNANHNLTYSWSPVDLILDGMDTATPTVSTENLGSQTYVVEIGNQYGCSTIDSINLIVVDTSAIPDVVTSWMCDELTVNFLIDDTTGTNYLLNFGDPLHPDSTTTDLESTYTYSDLGNYTITLTIPGTEACTEPLEKEIEVIAPPFLALDFDYDITECSDSATIVLTDNSTSAFGEVTGWSWSFGNNTSATGSNPTIVINDNQMLSVELTVVNEFGCEETLLDTIPVNIVSFELPDTISACPGMPVALNSGAAEDLLYTWTPSTYLDNPNAGNPFANAPAGTVITYEAFVTDTSGVCTSMDEVTVIVAPDMTNLMVSDDQFVCEDTMVVLSAFSNEATGYIWTDDNNMVVSNEPTLTTSPGIIGTSQMFMVQLSDAQGCIVSDSVMLTNASIGIVEPLDEEEICFGDEATLFAEAFSVEGVDLMYSWSPLNNIVSANADSSEIVVQPEVSTTYIYEASNEFGCTNSLEIDVLVSDLGAIVDAMVDPDTIFRGQKAQLDATRDDGYDYLWTPEEDLNDPTISNPQATPLETTDYTVTVTDEMGCTTMASVRITVLSPDCAEPFLFFPNAFTPNGDGFNDVLYLRAPFELDEVYFVIYSRWGEKVFESNSLDSGWDGSFKGEELATDVYGFYLRVRCTGGETYTKKGNVTLLR